MINSEASQKQISLEQLKKGSEYDDINAALQ
jgi:hypothetical protein